MHDRPIIRDQKYLDYLKTQPCILTGIRGHNDRETVDPIHIGTAGKGLKRSDDETLPVIHRLHALGHQKGEISMLRQHAPDWLLREAFRAYARQLYREWKEGQQKCK